MSLRDYEDELRLTIVRSNNYEKLAFLISNDFAATVEFLMGEYARRCVEKMEHLRRGK